MRVVDYSDKIQGLSVIEEFVTEQEETSLIDAVDKETWCGLGISPNPELKRRTQQYGHLFSYRYRKVLQEYGPLPAFVESTVARIMEHKLMPQPPNHLLINEYNAGQGIMPHVGSYLSLSLSMLSVSAVPNSFIFMAIADAPTLFGPAILSLSLLSACIMRFSSIDGDHTVDVLLPRRSIVVLSGAARYQYKHSISKDLIETSSDGVTVQRDRRVSYTFRTIIAWEASDDCGCDAKARSKADPTAPRAAACSSQMT
ncbi:uncharacterized protein BYT42DRAFT_508836 [Radiomyces spectabilis]|uniref:uncharacterized protein n=1 Tax=Radiomyces spectabilis TaxID=64574 RepID=UPI00221F7687|nr:uncharacterized protein BYT42DRAFT_508836 [Radiomyces spectabilis]KAI8391062.1 hypothetical protein BYT42DRAFT_508836 [Radiomyces spectabilis]